MSRQRKNTSRQQSRRANFFQHRCGLESLEGRQMMTSVGPIENTFYEQAAEQVAQRMNEFAEQANVIARKTASIPVFGDEIYQALAPLVNQALRVDVPLSDTRKHLESLGFSFTTTASAPAMIHYRHTFVSPQTLVLHSDGQLGANTGIHFQFEGDLLVRPEITLDIEFGLDANGELFVMEGSSVVAALNVDGTLTGNASIPNLVGVRVEVDAPQGEHLAHLALDLVLSDFDAMPNERLYLFDAEGPSLFDLLGQDQAISVEGGFDLDAQMSVDSPIQQLPEFLRGPLAKLLPSELSWSANVTYDLATETLDYTIQNESLTNAIQAFQSDGVEEAVYRLMVAKVAEHNPLPESVQRALTTKLPLVGKDLLDLLDVPKAAQFLIAPHEFLNKQMSDLESKDEGNKLDFNFDLFSASNLANLLSGKPYNIISLDIAQRFEADLQPITVMPDTTVFTYAGLASVSVQFDLIPSLFFAFDVQLGLDSEGFYLLGETKADVDSGKAERHVEIGGGITGRVIGTGKLIEVLDLVRITVDVGLLATGGFTFQAPHEGDLKMRVNEIVDEKNIYVSAGIDLNLGLKGEVGILALDLKSEVHEEKTIELYRSKATSLSDIRDKLESFKEKLETEGREIVFAGAALGDANCIALAATILYKEHGQDLVKTAKAFHNEVTKEVNTIAKALYQVSGDVTKTAQALHAEVTQDLGKIAKALRDEVTTEVGKIAKALYQISGDVAKTAQALHAEVTQDLGKIAKALHDEVTKEVRTIAKALYAVSQDVTKIARALHQEVTRDLGKIAKALHDEVTPNLGKIAKTVQELSNDLVATAKALWDGVTQNPIKVAKALWEVTPDLGRIATALDRSTDANLGEIAKALHAVDDQLDRVAAGLWNGVTKNPAKVAKALWEVTHHLGRIATALDRSTDANVGEIAQALYSADEHLGRVAGGLWDGVTKNPVKVAKALWEVTHNLGRIAGSLYRYTGSTLAETADALYRLDGHLGRVTGALHGNATDNTVDIARALWNGVTHDLTRIAGSLHRYAGQSLNEVAYALYHGASRNYNSIALALWEGVAEDPTAIAKALRHEIGASLGRVASILMDEFGTSTKTTARILVKHVGASLSQAASAMGISLQKIKSLI